MGKLIRIGEAISSGRGEVNHMFIVDYVDKDQKSYVIQAELKGVTRGQELTGEYIVLQPPKTVNTAKLLKFARRQVGLEYGVLTIFAIAFDIVTWQWVPSLRGARKPSWICSALGAESARFGGWLADFIDIYSVTPQQVLDAMIADGWEVVVDTIHA
jgi:hypothetical protein